jgi:pimeloyl-ACP methyl ester carboxylesterase
MRTRTSSLVTWTASATAILVLSIGCNSTSSASHAVDAGAAPVIGRYASVNGLKMYYEVHGVPGARPPLVLVHGGGSTIDTSFGAVLPALGAAGQVIAFEQQGNGRTADIPDRPFTFEQSADDCAELLRQLGIRHADFYGYSNGANIILQVAIRHPELVRRMVVAAGMYRNDGLIPELHAQLEHATAENMPPELRDAYLAVAPRPQDLPVMIAKSAKRMLEFEDWSPDVIKGIQSPTLVLIGDRDVVRPEHAVEMFRLLPHGQLAILPGTDHMQLIGRKELLIPIIRSFLDDPQVN